MRFNRIMDKNSYHVKMCIRDSTDTIATMTGAIVGALYGANRLPAHYLPTVEKANGLPISPLAVKITALAEQRMNKEEL